MSLGFGVVPDEFKTAIQKYGVFPTTVWDVDFTDKFLQYLKKMIGDGTKYGMSARAGCFGGEVKGKGYSAEVPESTFNPIVGIWIMNLYGPKEGTVYDPFAGGGARAIIVGKYGLNYVGMEIRQQEVDAVMQRLENNEVTTCKMICGDSRFAPMVHTSSADFLITCPPYYNMEKYNGGDADLSMTGTYDDFLTGMELVITDTRRILKPGALSCWVIGLHRDKEGGLLPMNHDISAIHRNLGFTMKEEIIIHWKGTGAVQRVGNFEKGNKLLVRTHEYCLVFKNNK
jgi:hypothetical protein